MRSLLAFLVLCACCATASCEPAVDRELDALIARQPASDVRVLREALQGPLGAAAVDLQARAGADRARRSLLIVTTGPGYPQVTLWVDEGAQARLYRWMLGFHRDVYRDGGKFLRETTPAEFDGAWHVLAGRRQTAAAIDEAHGGYRSVGGYDGFVLLRDGAQAHQWLLSPDDFETLHHSSALQDLIGSTPLGLGEYHPGIRSTAGWLATLEGGLDALPGTERQRRQDALRHAVEHARWEEARGLVADGADPDFYGRDGATMLSWALVSRQCDAAAHLLELGAHRDKPNFFGDTAESLTALLWPKATATPCNCTPCS